MKNWRVLILIFSGFILLAMSWIWKQWGSTQEVVRLTQITHEEGYAYQAIIPPPDKSLQLWGWTIKLQYKWGGSDSGTNAIRSKLRLFEDGKDLTPGHCLHDKIRTEGKGCFSHWNDVLYFSSSDNTSPLENGKTYTFENRMILKGFWKKIFNFVCFFVTLMPCVAFASKYKLSERYPTTGRPNKLSKTPSQEQNPSSSSLNFKYILFSTVLCLIVLFALEIVLRISYPFWFAKDKAGQKEMLDQLMTGQLESSGWFPAYIPHHYMAFTLAPKKRLFTGEIVHTEDGFRAPAMSHHKPKGVYRIALLGGSITYENGYSFLGTYAAYLEEALERTFPDKKIDVLNAAVGGYTSAESLIRFHFKVLDYEPDMIVISDGLNDIWPRLYHKHFTSDYSTSRRIMVMPPSPTEKQRLWMRLCYIYRAYYWFFQLKQNIPDLMNLIYYPSDKPSTIQTLNETTTTPYRRNIEDMIHIAKGRNIKVMLVTQPVSMDSSLAAPCALTDAFRECTRQHNEVLHGIAKNLDVPVYSLDQTLPQEPGVFGDICHLGPEGNRIKAYLVATKIAKILQTQLQQTPIEIDEPLHSNPGALRGAVVHRTLNGKEIQITQEFLKTPSAEPIHDQL